VEQKYGEFKLLRECASKQGLVVEEKYIVKEFLESINEKALKMFNIKQNMI
jgi:hypothetical protein